MSSPSDRRQISRAGLVVILGALTAFAPVGVDLYLPAFPAIARHFGTDAGSLQLSLSTYLVGLALGQVVYGPLSDRLGRRPPLVAGIVLFVGVSVACAFAPSVGVLIGLRLLQGVGGCAGVVIARAVVRDLYAGVEAARFFSLLMLVFGAAPVIAPLVGAQILSLAGWRAVFLALAVYGVANLAALRWLPETLPPERRRTGGLGDALVSYREVLSSRAFVAYAAATGFGSAALIAYIALAPALLIEESGISPQQFGFVFGVNALALVLVSQIGGRRARRLGVETVLRRGVLAQTAAAVTLLAIAVAGIGGLGAILPVLLVIVGSVGAILPMGTALALTPFPHAAGAASAVVGTVQTGLGAVSAAAVSAIALSPAVAMGVMATVSCVMATAFLLLVAPRHRDEPSIESAPLA